MKKKRIPLNSWLNCRGAIWKARSKHEGRKIMGNTYLRVSRISPTSDWDKDGVVYALVYHYTEIIHWYPDGRQSFSVNGWNTITTKTRIRKWSRGSIGANRGEISGHAGGRAWPGNEKTWFFTNQEGVLCFEDGSKMPSTRCARIAKPIPKRRDTLSDPLPGDAFSSGDGKFWICLEHAKGCARFLSSYLGDHPDNPRNIVRDTDVDDVGLSQLELLSRSGGDWKAVPRFTWRRPPQEDKNNTQQQGASHG